MTTRARITAGLALALSAGTAHAQFTLSDGDATFSVTGPVVFNSALQTGGIFPDAGALDQLFRYGWYYRTPNNNTNRAMSSLDTPAVAGSGDTRTITWTNAGPGPSGVERFNAVLTVTLEDGAAPGQALVYATMDVTNPNPVDVTYQFFHLLDLDILGGAVQSTNDTVSVTDSSAATGIRASFTDSLTTNTAEALGEAADRWELGTGATLQGKVSAGSFNLANNAGPVGPGDAAVAFQWTLAIPAGQTRSFRTVFALNTAADFPEPCPADCNGDTTLDAFDFNCFVDEFNAGNLALADQNGDTTLDAFDFNQFVDNFNAGCTF